MAETRNAPAWITWLIVIVGLALIAVAVVYFTQPAGSLPSFFPGHKTGGVKHHTKHGAAAIIVAVILFVVAWMTSGRKSKAA